MANSKIKPIIPNFRRQKNNSYLDFQALKNNNKYLVRFQGIRCRIFLNRVNSELH